jgi:hypothetical protein
LYNAWYGLASDELESSLRVFKRPSWILTKLLYWKTDF